MRNRSRFGDLAEVFNKIANLNQNQLAQEARAPKEAISGLMQQTSNHPSRLRGSNIANYLLSIIKVWKEHGAICSRYSAHVVVGVFLANPNAYISADDQVYLRNGIDELFPADKTSEEAEVAIAFLRGEYIDRAAVLENLEHEEMALQERIAQMGLREVVRVRLQEEV